MKIGIIAGGLLYEKEEVIKAANDIKEVLDKYHESYIIDINQENEIEKINLNIFDTYFIVDPFYTESNYQKDIRYLLEKMQYKYTGANLKTASLCKDKLLSKYIVSKMNEQIKIPRHFIVPDNPSYEWFEEIIDILELPIIIKPSQEGSSIGVKLCHTIDSLYEECLHLQENHRIIMIEEYISGLDILNGVFVFNNEVKNLATIEIELGTSNIYDYENKNVIGISKLHIPARLPAELNNKIYDISKKIYNTFNCSGYSRIDYRLKEDTLYFLEINASPTMTWAYTRRSIENISLSYDDFILGILNSI